MKADEFIDTAVRVWTEIPDCGPPHHAQAPVDRPRFALVLDTETSTDASMRLHFGSYRYFRISWHEAVPLFTCVEEGIFYADDLAECDPEGLDVLRVYAQNARADVDPGLPDKLWLRSETEFLSVLWEEAIKKRSLIVGFNLPFDLSRFAFDWGESSTPGFPGGFSLALWQRTDGKAEGENKYRPRLVVKSIDSKRALKGFSSTRETDWIDRIAVDGTPPRLVYSHRGHLLDLRTLVYALTDKGHSLASACTAFGVEHGKEDTEEHGLITPTYIDYNRADVRATAELLEKVLTEYYRHPIDLQPTKAYSPASIGKAYLRAFGVTPILERQQDFALHVLGQAMEAYYGGRAECRIRHQEVPVVHLDFLSMYPTVNALMDLWSFHIAERIHVDEATDETRALVDEVGLGACLDRGLWPHLATLVKVRPDCDVLPVRARYDEAREGWQIGVNPLTGDPRWHTLADVIGSKLLTRRAPEVLEAIALRPEGMMPGLLSLKLRGEVEIDPYMDDPFRLVIETRQRLASQLDLPQVEREWRRLFLKIFANGTSYGILAEMNRQDGLSSWVEIFSGLGSFGAKVSGPERRGGFAFPPLPAFISGGARLMLAILESLVSERGGTYAICDTDSMSIVASEHGGEVTPGIHALSWDEVDEVRDRFVDLNPYEREVIGSILKLEDVNFLPTGERCQLWCYAISAKRYVHFNRLD